jgi:predicted peptidase
MEEFMLAKSLWALALVALAAISAAVAAESPATTTAPAIAPKAPSALDAYEAATYTDPSGGTLLYRLHKPAEAAKADAKTKFPAILFLHGSGGNGADNAGEITDGGSSGARVLVSPEVLAKYPCYIIAPQCPRKQQWVNTNFQAEKHALPEKPSDSLRMAVDLTKGLLKELPIDPSRVYITGVSAGGFGTWDALARNPGLFAAAVIVCGGADEATAPAITQTKIPLWVFHGKVDPTVKPIRATHMVAALKEAGSDVKFTEYPGVGHNSWEKAYTEKELFPWLFAQTLKK